MFMAVSNQALLFCSADHALCWDKAVFGVHGLATQRGVRVLLDHQAQLSHHVMMIHQCINEPMTNLNELSGSTRVTPPKAKTQSLHVNAFCTQMSAWHARCK